MWGELVMCGEFDKNQTVEEGMYTPPSVALCQTSVRRENQLKSNDDQVLCVVRVHGLKHGSGGCMVVWMGLGGLGKSAMEIRTTPDYSYLICCVLL